MFATQTRSPKTNNTKAHESRRLQVEPLEDRRMMIATHMVIDFTPDYRPGTFLETFQNSVYSNGQRPSFLDFNGDRQITPADAQVAARQIMDAVGKFYSGAARGYNVDLNYVDATLQTYGGANALSSGLRSNNDQVLVMYVGGRNTGEIGQAPRAPDGYNVEGYGQTYSQEIANMLMRRSGMTPAHFVWACAGTISHELGHMLGLRHSLNVYSNDIMNPAQSLSPWNDFFSTVYQNTEKGGPQNAFRELQSSFAGQPTLYATYNGGSRLMPAGADLGGETDHDHDGHNHEAGESCDFDLNAFLDSIAGEAAEVVHAERAITGDTGLDAMLAKSVTQTPGSANDALSGSLRSKSAANDSRSPTNLVTLLANDLQGTSRSSHATPLTKTAASVNHLDDLFTDLGLVTAK